MNGDAGGSFEGSTGDACGGGTCFLRARQNRPVAGQFIQATAPPSIS